MSKWHDFPDAQIAARPDAPAFEDNGGARWTYAELDAAIDALAGVLVENGVQPRDRVLILAENCCAAVAALFACSRLGACAIPFNARQTAGEVQRVIDHARPAAVLFTSSASAEAWAAAHPGRGDRHLRTQRVWAEDHRRDREILDWVVWSGRGRA